VQARTAGSMEGDALKKELARVRHGAADLLQQPTANAPAVAPEQTARRASGQKKSRTQWRHRRRTREETSPADADRSWVESCRQSGGQNARRENDGQDIPSARARLVLVSLSIWRSGLRNAGNPRRWCNACGRTSIRIARSAFEFCVRTVSHTPRNPGSTPAFRGIRACTSLLREVVYR
jgi:hypothetical protein